MNRLLHRILPLLLLLVAIGCATPQLAPTRTVLAPGDRVELPLGLVGGGSFPAVAVEGMGEDGKPAVMLLDTGAAGVIVTSRFVARHALQTRGIPGLRMTDALGRKRKPKVARIPALNMRGASFEAFDAVVDDLPGIRASIGEAVDVVIGRPLFRDVLLTIDYPRRRLVIERGALPPPDGRDVLPLVRGRDGDVLVPVTVAGRETWMLLDTGHTVNGLQIAPEHVAGAAWASPPVPGPSVTTFFGTADSRLGRLAGEARIGRYTIRRPIVCLVDGADGEYLGSDVLRHFAITIDQRNDRVRFARASEAPIEVPPLRTLGFGLDRDGTVQEILPTSAAAAAGLRMGDRVLSMNGAPLTWLRSSARAYFEGRNEPVRLQVVRDGTTRTLTVPVTTLVP